VPMSALERELDFVAAGEFRSNCVLPRPSAGIH
jgi:hypothetical protein